MELLDILTYPARRSERGEPSFESEYVGLQRRFSRKYFRYKPLISVLSAIVNVLQRERDADVVFLGTSFLNLMLQTSAHYRIKCIVQDEHELLTALRYRIPLILAWKWKAVLYRACEAAESSGREDLLEGTVSEIQAVLEDHRPRAVVLRNDSLFLERAVVLAARVAGIRSLTVQHGLFMQSAGSHVYDGYWTDHMLVWGDFFRDLYIEKEILPAGRVHVLGYPFPIEVESRKAGDESPVVCLLGQPWEHYDRRLLEMKNSIISNLMEACSGLELDLVYRPHPSEHREELVGDFPDLELTGRSETLQEAIERYDVFFSMTSTALIEAALRGKVAVQIRTADVPMDNFGDVGACYSIENEPGAIRDFLDGVKSSRNRPLTVSGRYIYTAKDLGRAFTSIVESVTAERD